MIKNVIQSQKNVKVFIPCHFETDIKGFWLDDKGKLYIDNIIIQKVNVYQLQRIKHTLFSKGEKAVFYVQNGIAHIEDKAEGLTLLKNCISITFKNKPIDDVIISICKNYGGCTLYKRENDYLLETWTK